MWFVLREYSLLCLVRLGVLTPRGPCLETPWCCQAFVPQDRRHQEAVCLVFTFLREMGINEFPNVFCRNRASGTPHNAPRKGTAGLPKIAAGTSRPRSSTTNSMPSSISGARLSPTNRVGASAAGVGSISAMKRQRRTSAGAQLQPLTEAGRT